LESSFMYLASKFSRIQLNMIKNAFHTSKIKNLMERNALFNLKQLMRILRDQSMSTISLITSIRTTEDMSNHVIANN